MNEDFLARMKSYLKEEYDDFYQSMSKPLLRGLRYNPKKKMAFIPNLKATPFSKDSYYIDQALGNHPGHICGAFYLQEPSATSAVTILDVKENDYVLDLCAAPGGKSTQIAGSLKHGFLLSNEINKKRAQILLSNIERCGIQNVLVTNDTPSKICHTFKECFDKVLVDAPCSGEGMMKKHDEATNWSQDNVDYCSQRQKEILADAYLALKKDGILVYSTCTYAKEENEEVVQWFLDHYPDMELIDPKVSFGRKGFNDKTIRIFPMDGGEGHFVAKLQKKSGNKSTLPVLKDTKLNPLVETFLKEQLGFIPNHIQTISNSVYAMDLPFINTKKINGLRQGILLGELKKNRFEPAHSFYMNAEWIDSYQKKYDASIEEMNAFMHGETLSCDLDKGYYAICFEGIPFGFGKSDGHLLKNKIPKGLRLLPNSKVHI